MRGVALNGAPVTSSQGYFADAAARDAANGAAPVVFPVLVDHVGTQTATAHEQGSSIGNVSELRCVSADGRPVLLHVDGDRIGDVTEAVFGILPGVLRVVA